MFRFKSKSTRTGLKTEDPKKLSDTSVESASGFVLGIDFGTTFTGVAYALGGTIHLAQPNLDRSKIAEKVVIIRAWPGSSSHYAEKTPTVLSYNTSPPSWGGKVKPNDEPQVSLFKLGLQENLDQHYLPRQCEGSTRDVPSGYPSNRPWVHPLLPQKPVDYVADYLTCICQYILKERLPRQYGPQ